MGLSTVILVVVKDIYFFYACSYLYGLGGGGVSVACNSNCLEIWRGRDDGCNMMHAIHFFGALGNFIGSVIASPFIELDQGKCKIVKRN